MRLGPAIDAILKRHAYPEPVARLVGEAAALTVLLGSTLKLRGPLPTADEERRAGRHADRRFRRALELSRAGALRPEDATGGRGAAASDLLGRGHLAFTIDPGGDMSRYQGVVALEGQGLEEAAHHYFERSEQIPTLVRLAVGEIVTSAGAHGGPAA